jgi:hypothetical protein
LWILDLSEREVISVVFSIELLREIINTLNFEDLTIGMNIASWCNLITSQVVVACEVLTWLVDIKTIWEFLSAEKQSKGITAIVRVVDFTDFNCVIGQVVVYYVW